MKNAVVAVCDDEPAVCDQVKQLVEKILGRGTCKIFNRCNKFIEKIEWGGGSSRYCDSEY